MMTRAMVEQTADEDAQGMVRECDPAREFVAVPLKTHDRVSAYRLQVIGRGLVPQQKNRTSKGAFC